MMVSRKKKYFLRILEPIMKDGGWEEDSPLWALVSPGPLFGD